MSHIVWQQRLNAYPAIMENASDTQRCTSRYLFGLEPGQRVLEAAHEFQNSTVRDDQFDTDRQALDELMCTIADEGIGALIGIPGKWTAPAACPIHRS
jgi:hypothetical protein